MKVVGNVLIGLGTLLVVYGLTCVVMYMSDRRIMKSIKPHFGKTPKTPPDYSAMLTPYHNDQRLEEAIEEAKAKAADDEYTATRFCEEFGLTPQELDELIAHFEHNRYPSAYAYEFGFPMHANRVGLLRATIETWHPRRPMSNPDYVIAKDMLAADANLHILDDFEVAYFQAVIHDCEFQFSNVYNHNAERGS